jgi:hypothetical protein
MEDGKMPAKLFAPFEIALQEFYLAGGAHVATIRAPGKVLQEFVRVIAEGGIARSYMRAPIALAPTQSTVSIRGRTVTGQLLEFPGPTKWSEVPPPLTSETIDELVSRSHRAKMVRK